MSTDPAPKKGPLEKNPREYSGRRLVALFLGAALVFSAIVLGLFYFYFFDILKDYRKRMPPPPRTSDRG